MKTKNKFLQYINTKKNYENDAFCLFNQGHYHEAYVKLKELESSTDENIDKASLYFILGFILEFDLTKDRNVAKENLPDIINYYYNQAEIAGCIGAKARKCFFNEKKIFRRQKISMNNLYRIIQKEERH